MYVKCMFILHAGMGLNVIYSMYTVQTMYLMFESDLIGASSMHSRTYVQGTQETIIRGYLAQTLLAADLAQCTSCLGIECRWPLT